MAWKFSDWLAIIQQINDLSTNPPEGCTELTPLDEPSPINPKWSVAEVIAARDRLLEICDTNSFTVDTVKWTQTIIDELATAIDNGWCGCESAWEGPYTVSLPPDHYYELTNVEVFPNFPTVGWTTRIYYWIDSYNWWNCSPCPIVGPSGITGRTGTLTVTGTKTAVYGGATTDASFIVSGDIDINGSIGWLASRGGSYTKTTGQYTGYDEYVQYSDGYTFNFTSSELYVDRP